ncbi:MAG TPA: HAMP domain-containing sensor histidine kinase [Solirubrobacteraceae bacterium]
MSLRARLLAGMLVLITVALVVAAFSIYAEQRSFLSGRLDQRVIEAAAPISYQLGVDARQLKRPSGEHRAGDELARPPSVAKALGGFLPSDTWGALIGSGGTILRGPVSVNYGDRRLPGPKFSSLAKIAQLTGPRLFNAASRPGSHVRYRVAALPLETGAGTLIVAVPRDEVDETLDRLVIVEALVVAAAVLLLVGLGWLVIKVALRPLDQMGRVASTIAGGDLSRRVRPATPRTEVGRLGISLNRMLVRIEDAFRDRDLSEDRRRQFLSDASHELRTPLASIRGYAELFRLGPAKDPEALARAMARIEDEAERMGVLVEDLLQLARLDELPEPPRERVNLTELAEMAATDARAAAPDRPITCLEASPVQVMGDLNGLRRVLANLMGNAVLHTPDDAGIEIAVSAAGSEALITVRDHGPGLPPGSEELVFDRFWRAEGRTRLHAGSGLGLSIVKEIVTSHHGTVKAGNHPHGGAVFTVWLPLATPAGDAESRPPERSPAVA